MEIFYLALIVILFLLAISDLVVGVSNDAVNFLNSALGSKASSFKAIMLVAALGVLIGATFSSGMMEVARKGIFHPEHFYFAEIMLVFLAVMVTDVVLLDTFNSFGMPTSTTVSIVFELLGAAVAISIIKQYTDPNALDLGEYINSGKALAIISGILLSVIVAFSAGVIAQYMSRLLFSFDYEKPMRKYGAIFGGLGISVITYYILIKGAKGASFMSNDLKASIHENTNMIMLACFIGWTLFLFFMNRLFNLNILKVMVLIGTFALAMAFSGNDLVNFIGVPLAGYNSYELFIASGVPANELLMDSLAGKVPTPTLLLLLAGVIMVITLYTSKKAKLVVKTSLDLGRQDTGSERFSSFLVSRSLVRNFSSLARRINSKLPDNFRKFVDKQFDQTPFIKKQVSLGDKAPAFDMLRAAVTLVIASILIAIGTNMKLPLSTTYVTFMVFMGTSLADGAWGRESAVYRVSGVMSVVGGWFFTAFSAFTVAFILALIFHFTGMIGIVGIIVLTGFVVFRTHKTHEKREADHKEMEKRLEDASLSKAKIIDLTTVQLKSFLNQFDILMEMSLEGMKEEDLKVLSKSYESFQPVAEKIDVLNIKSSKALDKLPDNELEAGHVYILIIDYLNEMSKKIERVLKMNLDHVDNNHKPLLPEQINELKGLSKRIRNYYGQLIDVFESMDRDKVIAFKEQFLPYTKAIRAVRKKQIKRIKNHEVGTRNSVLYLNVLGELRNLVMFADRIVRVFDDLILNPSDEGPVLPAEIKEDLKRMDSNIINIKEEE